MMIAVLLQAEMCMHVSDHICACVLLSAVISCMCVFMCMWLSDDTNYLSSVIIRGNECSYLG